MDDMAKAQGMLDKEGDIGIKYNYEKTRTIYFHADPDTAKLMEQYGTVEKSTGSGEDNLYVIHVDSRYNHDKLVKWMLAYRKPVESKVAEPQRKTDFLVSSISANGFGFFGDENHIEALKRFGSVVGGNENNMRYFHLDQRYKMSDVIEYIESL